MRVAITADLHYDVPRSRATTEQLAQQLRALQPDVLVPIADLPGRDTTILERSLRLFEPMRCPRLLAIGNHGLWCGPDQDSLLRLRATLAPAMPALGGALSRRPAALFAELAHHSGQLNRDLANAFVGSERFGQALLAEPKLWRAFCGHGHRPPRLRSRRLQCVNIGSTYSHEPYEVLEL